MYEDRSGFRNSSGAPDPTAFQAVRNIERPEFHEPAEVAGIRRCVENGVNSYSLNDVMRMLRYIDNLKKTNKSLRRRITQFKKELKEIKGERDTVIAFAQKGEFDSGKDASW